MKFRSGRCLQAGQIQYTLESFRIDISLGHAQDALHHFLRSGGGHGAQHTGQFPRLQRREHPPHPLGVAVGCNVFLNVHEDFLQLALTEIPPCRRENVLLLVIHVREMSRDELKEASAERGENIVSLCFRCTVETQQLVAHLICQEMQLFVFAFHSFHEFTIIARDDGENICVFLICVLVKKCQTVTDYCGEFCHILIIVDVEILHTQPGIEELGSNSLVNGGEQVCSNHK
jgi:hypothetical protein